MMCSQRHLTRCMLGCLGTGGFFAIIIESWMARAGISYEIAGFIVACVSACVLMIGMWMVMSNTDRERREADARKREPLSVGWKELAKQFTEHH